MLDENEITERKKTGFGARAVITLMMFFFVVAGIVVVLRTVGKARVTKAVAGSGETAVAIGEQIANRTEEASKDDAPRILYKGKEYVQNEDLLTVLVMGIDKENAVEVGGQSWSAESEAWQGGQADALFLLLINPHDKSIRIVAINRNTMTEVDTWDAEGRYAGVYTKQIALQHGYGDGGVESCERQAKCVSRLFRGITINAYAAISMDAIPELNDAVGGITVEVLDDVIYPEYDMDLHQGDEVTLYGEKAYWYVRLRNENVFDSNTLRQRRQQQYLTTFVVKAKTQAMQDVRVAVDLYKTLQKYMVTDIDLSSFTYLATEYVGYNFDVKNVYSLKGETIQGNRFEEFYADKEALEDLIVELFFEPVKE